MMAKMRKSDDLKRGTGIKDLYPNFSKDQLKEAGDNLNRYLEVCTQIFEENEEEAKDLLKRFQCSRKLKSYKNQSTTTF